MNTNFLLTCNDTSFGLSRLFFETDAIVQIEATKISFDSLTISYSQIARECTTNQPGEDRSSRTTFDLGRNLPYTLFITRNKLTLIGCDAFVFFYGSDEGHTGCDTFCSNNPVIANGSCSGEGCCQVNPKKETKKVTTYVFLYNSSFYQNVSNCSVAFIVEDWYNFTSTDVVNFEKTEVSVVLEWAVSNGTCAAANRSPVRATAPLARSRMWGRLPAVHVSRLRRMEHVGTASGSASVGLSFT